MSIKAGVKFAPAILALCSLWWTPGSASAEALTGVERVSLARDFLNRLKGIYDKAESPAAKDGLSGEEESLSYVQDGETLLFRPRIDDFVYESDIYALKHDKDVYLSLMDAAGVLGLAIQMDEDALTANGWFLREDWAFDMDLKAGKVVARDHTYSVSADDYVVQDGTVFIRGKTLGAWLGIDFAYDLAQQYVQVQSPFPLPAYAQHERHKRKFDKIRHANKPVLPRMETEYSDFEITTADVSVQSNYRKRGDTGTTSNRVKASVSAQGQILQNNAFGLASLDKEERLESFVGRLSRREEDPILLGSMKARSYTFGDTDTTPIPLTGGAGQEFGARITNNPLTQETSATTVIEGDAAPGWDVELYRNGGLVDLTTVEDNGRYIFDRVPLFVDANDFDLYFYGPQGEIRRESVSIPVSREILTAQGNTYDVSASLTDSQTYLKYPSETDDKNTPHLAGKYNFLVGDSLAYLGARARSVNGEAKMLASAGLTHVLGGTFIDTIAGVDEQGQAGTQISARRNFGDLNLSLNSEFRTDEYAPEGGDQSFAQRYTAYASSPFPDIIGRNSHVDSSAEYTILADGRTTQRYTSGFNTRLGPIQVGTRNRYEIEETTEGEETTFDKTFSVRGRYQKLFWRAGLEYDIEPEKRIDEYNVALNYQHDNRLGGEVEVRHTPGINLTEGKITGNIIRDQYRVSPFVQYDSDKDLYAGMNVRFGLIKDPTQGIVMTSKSTVNRGIVTAMVFLDRDGDKRMDDGEEPLPDVIVESLNFKRRVRTDENGIARIMDLPAYFPTDIQVDKETFPEPYMVPAFKGVSVASQPGAIYDLTFPVHYTGELDGAIGIRTAAGAIRPGKFIRAQLIPLENEANGIQVAETASDGFFIFSLIPPGRYYLTADPNDVKNAKAGRPVPQLVTIGYDGQILYGQNLELHDGVPDIDLAMLTEADAYQSGLAPIEDRRMAAPDFYLRLDKQKSSKLLNVLFNMRSKKLERTLLAGLEKIELDVPGQKEKLTRYHVPGHDITKAYEICRQFLDARLACRVEAALPPSNAFVSTQQQEISQNSKADEKGIIRKLIEQI